MLGEGARAHHVAALFSTLESVAAGIDERSHRSNERREAPVEASEEPLDGGDRLQDPIMRLPRQSDHVEEVELLAAEGQHGLDRCLHGGVRETRLAEQCADRFVVTLRGELGSP